MSPTNKEKGPTSDDTRTLLYIELSIEQLLHFHVTGLANIDTNLVICNRFGENISNFFLQSSTDAYSSAFKS